MTEPVSYDTIEDVKLAFLEEDIDREAAVAILTEEFDQSTEDAEALIAAWTDEDEAA